VDALKTVLDNPELKSALVAELKDELTDD